MLLPNTRYKWLIVVAPFFIILFMLGLVQYISYPQVDSFEIESISVLSSLKGLNFLFMFGLGLSQINSVLVIITLLTVVWVTIFYIIRRFVK